MNQYLYPWHDLDGHCEIGSVFARSFAECEEKLSQHLVDKYDQLDDTLEYEELLDQLNDIYGVYIGDIYDITEF